MTLTAHSPNRKPRTRRSVRGNVKEVQMKRALEVLASVAGAEPTLAGIERRIAEIIGVSASTLQTWREDYGLFGEQFDEIVGAVKARAGASLAAVLPEAVEVIKETVRGKQKAPLRFEAAHKVVKGFGVLMEKADTEVKVAVQVVNEPPKYIEVREAEKDKLFRERIEG